MRHDQNVTVLSVKQERLWRTDMNRKDHKKRGSRFKLLYYLILDSNDLS